MPLDWQAGVIVYLFEKESGRVCSNYWGIIILSSLVKSIQGYSGGGDNRTLTIRVLEGAWEFAQLVHISSVD